MANKLWTGLGAGAAVLTLGYFGGTFMIGQGLESKMQEAFTDLHKKNPMVTIKQLEFKKGFFSSTQKFSIMLGCDPDPSKSIIVTQEIQHGPVLWSDGTVGRASAKTIQVQFPAEVDKQIKTIFKDKPALTINSIVGFSSTTTSIESPAVNFTLPEQKGSVKWQGLTGHFTANKLGSSTGKAELSMPGISFIGADGESGEMLDLKLTSDSSNDETGFGLGDGAFSIASIKAKKAGEIDMMISNIQAKSSTKTNKNFIDVLQALTVKQITVNNKSYGPVDFDMAVNHLHIPSMKKVKADMDNMNMQACSPNTPAAEKAVEALTKSMAALLAQAPEVNINKLNAKFPEGEAKMSAKATVKDFNEGDIAAVKRGETAAVLMKFTAEAQASAPNALVEAIAKMAAPSDPQAAEAQLTSLRQEIANAISSGLVVRTADLLSIKAAWNKGAATINGKSVAEVMMAMQGQAQKTEDHSSLPR